MARPSDRDDSIRREGRSRHRPPEREALVHFRRISNIGGDRGEPAIDDAADRAPFTPTRAGVRLDGPGFHIRPARFGEHRIRS